MFNRGARLVGSHPHLEGDGPTARFMRFEDLADADVKAHELQELTVAWCHLMNADAAK